MTFLLKYLNVTHTTAFNLRYHECLQAQPICCVNVLFICWHTTRIISQLRTDERSTVITIKSKRHISYRGIMNTESENELMVNVMEEDPATCGRSIGRRSICALAVWPRAICRMLQLEQKLSISYGLMSSVYHVIAMNIECTPIIITAGRPWHDFTSRQSSFSARRLLSRPIR